MHYDNGAFERVSWTHRGEHMWQNHGITPEIADDALADPDCVVISPDHNSASRRSVRVIGYSIIAEEVITVIVLRDGDIEHGVNEWIANAKDRRIYRRTSGDADEQEYR